MSLILYLFFCFSTSTSSPSSHSCSYSCTRLPPPLSVSSGMVLTVAHVLRLLSFYCHYVVILYWRMTSVFCFHFFSRLFVSLFLHKKKCHFVFEIIQTFFLFHDTTFLYPFETDNTVVCAWRFEHAKSYYYACSTVEIFF